MLRLLAAAALTLLTVLGAMAVFAVATVSAQEQDEDAVPVQIQEVNPHWFQSWGYSDYVGAEIHAYDRAGTLVGSTTVDESGGWDLQIDPTHAVVIFQLETAEELLQTPPFALIQSILSGVSVNFFTADGAAPAIEGNTVSARIVARRAEDGRVEFGLRGPDGALILPDSRFFPAGGPGHHRWLRSTPVNVMGENGVEASAVIIARQAEDGRIEFALRSDGYADTFPKARYFPGEGPDHHRWLRSTELQLGEALAVAMGIN